MTCQVNRCCLVRLFEQPRAVKRCLRNQGIVVVLAKHLRALQRANNKRNCLQLRAALGNAVFVHRKRLNVQVIREVLEAAFIGDLRGEEK